MTHEWTLRGWDHAHRGDNPRVVIIGADSDHDAAHRCLVVCNVILKATTNAR